MHLETRIFLLVCGLVILIFVVNLLRTRRLKEEFALLWLMAAALLVLAPLGVVDLLDQLAYAVGIEYPPALILAIAILCLLGILFQYSLRISKFTDQIKVLTQEIALLKRQIVELHESCQSEGGRHEGE
jgi:hypothetical protein